ncbi:hypothetical protein Fmac_016660 [Flemingia macrophylla]|uniref:UDP-glycosyltransferase 83A1-like n=1 Tax=Flemingia macrophylla TaxID=520843 RepID=A0ABD1MIR3_9FABA
MSMATVLVLPFPVQGHVNPMAILSERLVEHGFKVIFVNTDFNHKRVVSSMVEQQHESLIKLVSVPDGLAPDDDRLDFGKTLDAILSSMPTSLEKLIEDIHLEGENKISFIVADFFMAWAMDVAAKFGIKGAIFCPCSAAVFASVYSIPKLLHDGILNSDEDLACMNWLDQQPQGSVTYVAFGSLTIFYQNQFNELALGLDLTNRPFLWVVRQDTKMAYPSEFQGHKGKIVAWAPQQKVLNHCAISCFVTHCGWNSTMESLFNGVSLLCWPYFADQIYNKTHICDELGVGLGLNSNENGFVSRWEIKRKLDELLSDEKIRTRSLKLKEKVRVNQGLSLENINKFVKCLKE